jgi:hypothetical protein
MGLSAGALVPMTSAGIECDSPAEECLMGRWRKVGLVCAGYALALVASVVAGYLYNARMAAMPYDTSGGMYAGGEFITVVGVFFVVALVPTLLALWFVRGNVTLWWVTGIASLGFASAGVLALLTPLVINESSRNPWLALVSLVSLTQLLGMPLWTVAFALFAFLAPTPPTRRLMVAAIGVELVNGVCAAIHWFVPRAPF